MKNKRMNRKWTCNKCGKGFEGIVTEYVANKTLEMHNKLIHSKKK